MLGGTMIVSLVLASCAAIIMLKQKPNLPVHRWLAFFLLFAAMWGSIINLQNPAESLTYNLIVVRLTFVSAVLMAYAMLQFSLAVTKRKIHKHRWVIPILTLVSVGLALSKYVISSVVIEHGVIVPHRAFLYYVIVAYIVALALLAISTTIRETYRLTSRKQKLRLRLISLGLIQGFVIGLLTNVILPNVLGSIAPARYGWIASMLWTLILVYAVVRHHFLDLRLAMVRSVAYFFVLITVIVVYFGVFVVLSSVIFDAKVTPLELVINVAIALLIALIFQPVKRFFDRLTDRLFYRDNYQSDDFYAQMNHELTLTTDLTSLLKKAANTIGGTLKAKQTFFFIHSQNNRHISIGTTGHAHLLQSEADLLDEYVAENGSEPLLVYSLEASHPSLWKILRKHGVSLLLPLSQHKEVTGYVCLGEQKRGEYTRRDLRVLSTIAGELVIAIQNALSVQEVKEFNETLQQRIDEATKELRTSNAQLQRLDAAKDEFISMASHQLRTPLTSVKGYISMVLEGDVGEISDMQHKLLEEAFISSERMVHLINDFLNVSRLQTGKFMIERRPVDLAKITRQEVDALQTIAKAHDLKLKFKAGPRIPVLYIDESKIRQVIMNFIDNAIYYSREFTTILIELTVEAGDVVLTVHDTGIGVPEAEQAHLFTKFFRATNARKQRPDGTGVGLFLAKKVVVAHGGHILFTSVEGEGSSFGFRLPIKKLELAPADDMDELKHEGDNRHHHA